MHNYVPIARAVDRPAVTERLTKARHYRGELQGLTEDEAARSLCELLAYFGFDRSACLPAPVVGTRGDPIHTVDRNVLDAMSSGVRLLWALGGRRSGAQVAAYIAASTAVAAVAEEMFDVRKMAVVQASTEAARRRVDASRGQRPHASEALVYFIAADGGPVKIGMAIDPAKRIRELQISHPTRLHLLATTEGGFYQEQRYHRRFAAHRLEGEWFARCRPVLAEIARLNRRPTP